MNKYDKATKLLDKDQVILSSETPNHIWFSVREIYWTCYWKVEDMWSCTCMSYIYNPHLECNHVVACKRVINKKGGYIDTEKKKGRGE